MLLWIILREFCESMHSPVTDNIIVLPLLHTPIPYPVVIVLCIMIFFDGIEAMT